LKIALSILCENPARPTGLTTLFHSLVGSGLRLFPDVSWLVFAGPGQPWTIDDPRVEVVRDFPANDRLAARLWADHFCVGSRARAGGASVLVTTGFMPLRAPLPVAMQVVTLHHGSAGFDGGGMRRAYRRSVLARGLSRAGLVIANSQYAADRLLWEQPELGPRLCVSPEGLDHARYHDQAVPGEAEAMARELGVSPGAVLWMSNFYPYKQAENLIAAYARLPADVQVAHPLVMVGGDWQGGRTQAQAAASRLGVEARFLGWVEERWLPVLYRQAALHALPSTEETFGRTVVEAMACGCPCVLNDIPALREVAAGAASLVNFAQVEAAATALHAVLTDGARANRLRAAGLERAAAFSFDRLAGERIAAIRAMVATS
jgi:glycosyltransferase involved in cell wall biosynthesis